MYIQRAFKYVYGNHRVVKAKNEHRKNWELPETLLALLSFLDLNFHKRPVFKIKPRTRNVLQNDIQEITLFNGLTDVSVHYQRKARQKFRKLFPIALRASYSCWGTSNFQLCRLQKKTIKFSSFQNFER